MEDLNLKNETSNTQLEKKKCTFNNKLNIVFNIILLLGLIILYIIFFNANKTKNISTTSYNSQIAFINTDSLKNNYLLVKEMKDTLEKKYIQIDNEMKQRQAAFESKVKDFQNKINSNSITMEQAQKIEQQLMIEQQTLIDLKEQYTNTLAEQEYQMNQRFIDSVTNFLQRYNKNKSFDYILGYTKGGGILFANEKNDITYLVIEGLNKEYKNIKK